MINLAQVIDKLAAVVKKLDNEGHPTIGIRYSFKDDKWVIMVQGDIDGEPIRTEIKPTDEDGIGNLFSTFQAGEHVLVESVKEVWYDLIVK